MKKIIIIVVLILMIIGSVLGLYYYKMEPEIEEIELKKVAFSDLPGWQDQDPRPSFKAFQKSCRVFLKQSPEKIVGSKHIPLKASDWQPLCHAAKQVDGQSKKAVKNFFETWFQPSMFFLKEDIKGLFTGYYMPVIPGSLIKTDKYKTPVYGVPSNLVSVRLGEFDKNLKHHKRIFGKVNHRQLKPYHDRKSILSGKIKDVTPTIAWIESPVDLQFLEIEGSGIIEFESGGKLAVGYAAENGHPYTSIAKILIESGHLDRHKASMQGIRKYFKENPEQVENVLFQNKSFVFFEKQQDSEAYGSQGVALTPGYSLAVDLKWVPIGTPLWLNTTRPDKTTKKAPMKRLMIAQDTGGAIRGPVRGDVYWGSGERAIFIAGHMKNMGYYWLLLPKKYMESIPESGYLNMNE